MKTPHSPAHDWANYLRGIALEIASVLVLLSVAGLVAWLVTLR
jgi:hypothetical protein